MTYGSVCSGIESVSLAWMPLGLRPAWFAEIDPFCCKLLEHRFPGVPNYGDIAQLKHPPTVDILVGGTPCQAFSVAGRRQGLDDPRGNLTLEFLRLAGEIRPRWVIWENVPGVLSIDGGRTFGAILGTLAKLGYGFAYRILDAQFFGVPQRRRRVFVVACLGDWRAAAAVLFEPQSVCRSTAPGPEARKEAPGELGEGAVLRGFEFGPNTARWSDVAPTIDCGAKDSGVRRNQVGLLVFGGSNTAGPINVATACNASGWRIDFDTETFVAHALRGQGFDGSEDGTGRGTPIVPVAFSSKDHAAAAGGNAPTLKAMTHDMSHANGGAQMAVRRLMPRECERLQGMPDDWTRIPVAHYAERRITQWKPEDYWEPCPEGGWWLMASDAPRYRAIGNAMAVPVVRWIGERILQQGENQCQEYHQLVKHGLMYAGSSTCTRQRN